MNLEEKVRFLEKYIVGRTDDYAVQTPSGRYTRANCELTEMDVIEHVVGTKTVGMYQMYDEGLVKWICYDIDDHDGESPTHIEYMLISQRLTECDIPFYVEHSGSEHSYHIWVFLEEPVDVSKAHYWAHDMITVKGVKLSSCEIYPKQQEYSPDKPYGNLVKMPLGLNRKNDARSVFDTDISIIHTVDISDYEVPEYVPDTTDDDGEACVRGGSGKHRAYLGMRPCFKGLLEDKVPLEGEQGHDARIYMAAEGWHTNGTLAGVCDLFVHQPDYDPAETEYQALSVKDYNRITCRTIKRKCWTLVSKYCERCPLN